MGSQTFPHQGSNKADALSAELQGRQFNGSGMLPPVNDLVNHASLLTSAKEQSQRANKKRSPTRAISLERR